MAIPECLSDGITALDVAVLFPKLLCGHSLSKCPGQKSREQFGREYCNSERLADRWHPWPGAEVETVILH